jgi:hypothetical protein
MVSPSTVDVKSPTAWPTGQSSGVVAVTGLDWFQVVDHGVQELGGGGGGLSIGWQFSLHNPAHHPVLEGSLKSQVSL